MSHYKPYPEYKESGVEWIGPVPKHWDIIPIKRFTKLSTARTSDAGENVTYIGLEDVESGSGKYSPTEGNSRQSDTSTVGAFLKAKYYMESSGLTYAKQLLLILTEFVQQNFLCCSLKECCQSCFKVGF